MGWSKGTLAGMERAMRGHTFFMDADTRKWFGTRVSKVHVDLEQGLWVWAHSDEHPGGRIHRAYAWAPAMGTRPVLVADDTTLAGARLAVRMVVDGSLPIVMPHDVGSWCECEDCQCEECA